ncbi:MAG: sugar ABC transporter ATP-binding protein [Hyphomicrobiales bacterium]|jgi:ribose transport system ATP-binding protein
MKKLVVQKVCRRYGTVQALDGVSLTIEAGQVHALMGENGAGKSTLIRLLAGLEQPDAGSLALHGDPLSQTDPAVMRKAGLRFIHQELHSIPGLSIAENMHLDHPYPTRLGLVDWKALSRAASQALERLDLAHLNPRAAMSDLGLGDQMLVRIAATLIASNIDDPWLYVMDEPTAALTTQEADRLFAVIHELTKQGAGVLYVSHRMPEVMRMADCVTVLRDGRNISSRSLADTNARTIIEDMTGRDLSHLFPARRVIDAAVPTVLTVRDLEAGPIRRADFDLQAGEILGVAGLAGSGRGELLRALIGAIPVQGGQIVLNDKPAGNTIAKGWANGFAYVPRERRTQGLMLRRSISENIALPHLSDLTRAGIFLDQPRQRGLADRMGKDVRIKATSVAQHCDELSGGNQQKVLFGRALAGHPIVLLLDEPTRGVDIGAKFELYRLIKEMSENGLAVIIASSDLPELLGLSHRIAIMRDGELAEMMETDGMTEADLLTRFYHKSEPQVAA